MMRVVFLVFLFTTQLFCNIKEYSGRIYTPHGIIFVRGSETRVDGISYYSPLEFSIKPYDLDLPPQPVPVQSPQKEVPNPRLNPEQHDNQPFPKETPNFSANSQSAIQFRIKMSKASLNEACLQEMRRHKPAALFASLPDFAPDLWRTGGHGGKFVGGMREDGLVEYHPMIPVDDKGNYVDLGSFISDRRDPFLYEIVQDVDKKALEKISDSIKSFSSNVPFALESHKDIYDDYAAELNKRFSYLTQRFGNYNFQPSALYTMFKYRISPWEMIDAINFGTAKMSESYNPCLRIYSNKDRDLHVLLSLNTFCKSDVVAVARDNEPLQEPNDRAERTKFYGRKHQEKLCIVQLREAAEAERKKEYEEQRFQTRIKNIKKLSSASSKRLPFFNKELETIVKKFNSYSEKALHALIEDFLNDHENPAPENWGTPPNYDRSDGCTFEGWNFSPSALIGMSVCGLAPHVVTAAIETSLCAAQGASVLAPALAAGPLLACVAVVGVALVVFDAQQKIITRILKAAEHIKNAITSYIKDLNSECVVPQSSTNTLTSEADTETISKTEDIESTDYTRTATGSPEPPYDLDDENDDEKNSEDKKNELRDKEATHIFKNEKGHFSHDTPENRELIQNLVNDKRNYQGTDQFGKKVYGKILKNGKQLWAYVHKNKVTSGGLNDIPKIFNSRTGFSSLTKPEKP